MSECVCVCVQEPALNPALEEQAIGRAWRMGQKREVTVKASGCGRRLQPLYCGGQCRTARTMGLGA